VKAQKAAPTLRCSTVDRCSELRGQDGRRPAGSCRPARGKRVSAPDQWSIRLTEEIGPTQGVLASQIKGGRLLDTLPEYWRRASTRIVFAAHLQRRLGYFLPKPLILSRSGFDGIGVIPNQPPPAPSKGLHRVAWCAPSSNAHDPQDRSGPGRDRPDLVAMGDAGQENQCAGPCSPSSPGR